MEDNEKQDLNIGKARKNLHLGQTVLVVQKHHQRSGELTEGVIKKFLTKSNSHPWGIKVMLEDGTVGRVKK
ncbi:YwbE family protein [Mangrovivirga cuniculi]|uniref:YwbE family protein n=1 Tax=Mangrovivirga cuniculi TaxID=2715131 RepID=A0A4D7JMH3_9BACT|nr:YwbE family protein [Mangrovivirga cuniculi]QCK16801.1 YwbE family protein [Mangrovivirga cuniculi]